MFYRVDYALSVVVNDYMKSDHVDCLCPIRKGPNEST